MQKYCAIMDVHFIEITLLVFIIIAILIKLVYFYMIPKRRIKMFIKSTIKWHNLTMMTEDLNENVETFLRISNYCNLVIWIGTGVLGYLVAFYLIFPAE